MSAPTKNPTSPSDRGDEHTQVEKDLPVLLVVLLLLLLLVPNPNPVLEFWLLVEPKPANPPPLPNDMLSKETESYSRSPGERPVVYYRLEVFVTVGWEVIRY